MIETAKEAGAVIVSNDRYEKYLKDHPWIKTRRVPVMIINGTAELYEPKLGENDKPG